MLSNYLLFIVFVLNSIKEMRGCFIYHAERIGADAAENICQTRYGTSLATISNGYENNIAMESCADSTCWIGINDKQTEGTFLWRDGSTPSYTNWYPGKPDAHFGSNSDCVGISKGDGLWADDKCDVSRYKAFLCDAPIVDYIYHEERIGADAAENICSTEYGTSLATISNAFENNIAQESCNDSSCWIGINDKQTEGTFLWRDGSTPSYTNWHPGKPDAHFGSNSDCVGISKGDGSWADDKCDISRYKAFLCNAPKSSSSSKLEPINNGYIDYDYDYDLFSKNGFNNNWYIDNKIVIGLLLLSIILVIINCYICLMKRNNNNKQYKIVNMNYSTDDENGQLNNI